MHSYPNMKFDTFERLLILVMGSRDPSTEEWKVYLEKLVQHGIPNSYHLVITEGGSPNSAQRHSLNEIANGDPRPCAVISKKMTVLGVTTALSWFNPNIKSFSPSQFKEALTYLGVPHEHSMILETKIDHLRKRIGIAPFFS
jgi:hypothetical protein